jgi:hypothetical protein
MASTTNTSRENLFEITSDVVLTDFTGKTYTLTGQNEEVSVQSIIIYESLESPYLVGEMAIVDNGINLIGTVPIHGMEKITFGIKTPYFSNTEYKFDFRISAVRNRTAGGKIQSYIIDLISYEGLQNEALRVAKTWQDYGQNIVKDIMTNNFKTKKKIDVEDCKYKMKFVPRGQRPFELIYSMLNKCIPGSFSPSTSKTSSSSIAKGNTTGEAGATDVKVSETISGSAGYFFWESYDGFKFKSIDGLCGGDIKYTYTYQLAKVDDGRDPGKSILEYNYTDEIDVMKKMRYGTYSSMMVFFNPSTGQYEEYLFDIDKSYGSMKHLGKDEKIPDGPKQLSKYPTRIMAQFLDHETMYNGTEIASPDPKDNSKSGTPFPDYKKHYTSQAVSRKLLLSNQELKVTVHGNLTLRAGDKITILLPNFAVDSLRKTEKYDKQHSGNYLIKEITYEFYRLKNNQPNLTVTNMTLVRDSFGSFTLDV